ncbi:hypothetical protein [Allochromatium tepidum]|uniref:3'-phosphate/5'-hydroxy nucleic acid ligase n=1 Tax=Allochromatium tepidum TaxID=553982 RepID=A0ABN6GF81_9GAMM|nr:hypothetical protein [Allochromatium tepidum]BCU07968.1 hypothetical protein Atep_26450 [Allochromatium tepidum]
MTTASTTEPIITPRVIASPSSRIEGEAIRQLEQTARLPGMRAAVGLPDLHPGKGYPTGRSRAAGDPRFARQPVLYRKRVDRERP